MYCKFCGKEMTDIEGIKGMHYKCSDLALEEYAGLKNIEAAAKQFVVARERCQRMIKTNMDWCVTNGPCFECEITDDKAYKELAATLRMEVQE
jgi:hypothetical protein